MQPRVEIWVVDLAELSKSGSCTALHFHWHVRISNVQSLCGITAILFRFN